MEWWIFRFLYEDMDDSLFCQHSHIHVLHFTIYYTMGKLFAPGAKSSRSHG